MLDSTMVKAVKMFTIIPFFSATKRTETICEGKTLNLECDKGKRLFISSAQYGYDDLIPQMCSRPSTLPANQNIGMIFLSLIPMNHIKTF